MEVEINGTLSGGQSHIPQIISASNARHRVRNASSSPSPSTQHGQGRTSESWVKGENDKLVSRNKN